MSLLEVATVTKRFGSLTALREVSFGVEEREIVGVIGPNGAGKSTLVNVIGGTATDWTGDVRFAGRSLRGLKPFRIGRLGVARTFQVAQPFARMTVADNVMVGALFGRPGRRPSLAEARDEAGAILGTVGLSDRAEVQAESLSIPERKRLEIARVLATHPRVLLLDEVMAGLNPTEIETAMGLIRDVRASGVTILLIEHVMQVITSLCDRIVVLDHGEKIAEGSAADVFGHDRVIEAYLGERYRREGSSA